MSNELNKRILRSINEKILLIYYCTLKEGYIFYVSGNKEYIYKIILNKKIQKCTCDDYFNRYFCKHLCFVLFKVLKIYIIDLSNFKKKLKYKNNLKNTNFFKTYIFDDLDWNILKLNFFNIKLENTFNLELYNIFKKNYYIFFNYYYLKLIKNKKCILCKNNNNKLLKCNNCENYFHINCLIKYLFNEKKKLCPICKNDKLNETYKYIILGSNFKINKNIIF